MHLLRLLLKSVPSISKVLSSRLLPADLFLQNISLRRQSFLPYLKPAANRFEVSVITLRHSLSLLGHRTE
ncbi:hypothetical protein SLA2020_183740 [Shorea laevis]